jgi:hypothetical protein
VELIDVIVSTEGFSLSAAVARFDVVELSVVAEANMASLNEQSGTGYRVGAGSLPAMDSISKSMPYVLLAGCSPNVATYSTRQRLHPTRLKRGQARIVDSRTARMGRIWCESWRLASN